MQPSAGTKEEGYTLLETVVAMSLFVAVLIPLVTVFGNLLLDRSGENLEHALAAAQAEINHVTVEKDFTSKRPKEDGGIVLERQVRQSGNIVEVLIVVTSSRVAGRELLQLHKSILNYP